MQTVYSFSATSKYNFNFPTSIRFGAGVVEELGPHLKSLGFKKPLIVSDPGLVALPVFKGVIDLLKQCELNPVVFSEIAKNPVKSNVLSGVKAYLDQNCDAIVGFGGGASMDVARAIALKAHHPLDLFEYDDALGGDRFVTEKIPYFVTVPTTSGTGSEVGRSTVIADDVTHEKKILFSPRLMAQKVFADPRLTLDLPPFVTAATGMDALTHNVEAYLAKGFSPLCEGVALEGIRLISQSLEIAVNGAKMGLSKEVQLEARAKMMLGSLMGATAFQKGLGIVHSLAHPLSTLVDMHHGLANAIMIPYGLEFNAQGSFEAASAIEEKFKNMALTVGISEKTSRGFIEWIRNLNARIGIPATLTGVSSAQVEVLGALAEKDPCHASNPKPVTRAQFASLYEKAIQGVVSAQTHSAYVNSPSV